MPTILEINSEFQKLDTLFPEAQGGGVINSFITSPITKNRIGEYKMVEILFTIVEDAYIAADTLLKKKIFFRPGLYINGPTPYPSPGSAPNNAFTFVVPNSPSVATEYPMTFVAQSGATPEKQENLDCTFEYINSQNFKIRLYFFVTYDEKQFVGPSYQDNHNRFLKSAPTDISELPGTRDPQTTYVNGEACLKWYMYLHDVIDTTTKGWNEGLVQYQTGWYDKNELETAPYFTNPVWTLERASGPVTGLSGVEDTKVTFKIDTPTEVSFILMHLIRTDSTNQNVDFPTNYEQSFSIISTLGSGTLHNNIKAPSTGPALLSGSTWSCDFYVDKTNLQYGQTYRFIAVVYYQNGETMVYEVNSHISPEEIVVDDLPKYNGSGLPITGWLTDYAREFYGNDLVCVIEERLRSTLLIDYSGSAYSNDIFARLGIVIPNDMTWYLDYVEMEMYYEEVIGPTTYKQVVRRETALKTGPGTYTAPSGMTLDFAFGVGQALFKFDWRNRYESWMPNVETYANGVLLTSPTGNQNWAGKVIYVRWKMFFYYYDYSTPFSDTLYCTQIIRPSDYDETLLIETQDDKEDKDYYCIEQGTLCLRAGNSTNSFILLNTIEPVQGNSSTIEESEQFTVSNMLPQMTTPKIDPQETYYHQTQPGKAKWCVQLDEVVPDTTYKVCAISKRYTVL